jgi:hypothetical protein
MVTVSAAVTLVASFVRVANAAISVSAVTKEYCVPPTVSLLVASTCPPNVTRPSAFVFVVRSGVTVWLAAVPASVGGERHR